MNDPANYTDKSVPEIDNGLLPLLTAKLQEISQEVKTMPPTGLTNGTDGSSNALTSPSDLISGLDAETASSVFSGPRGQMIAAGLGATAVGLGVGIPFGLGLIGGGSGGRVTRKKTNMKKRRHTRKFK